MTSASVTIKIPTPLERLDRLIEDIETKLASLERRKNEHELRLEAFKEARELFVEVKAVTFGDSLNPFSPVNS